MEQLFGQIGEVTNQDVNLSEIDEKNLQMPPMEADVRRRTFLVHTVMNEFLG